MGKRVKVKREKAPKLNIEVLRHGAEQQSKMMAVLLTGVVCAIPVGFLLLLSRRGNMNSMIYSLLSWYALGWMITLTAANGHRGMLQRKFPKSRVIGTAYPELRMHINQLCRYLDIRKAPDTFVIDTPQIGASVRGMGAPYLVLSSRMLQVMSEAELNVLLCVLLSHVKAATVKWRTFIATLDELNPLTRLLALPYVLMALLMRNYLDYSQQTADRLALLLLDGNYQLLTTTIIKTQALTSESITPQQAKQLEKFLNQEGVQARAEDVEHMYILNQMIREIPGLKERVEGITSTPNEPRFQEQLAIMTERIARYQSASRGM
jgi:hypothetical protein